MGYGNHYTYCCDDLIKCFYKDEAQTICDEQFGDSGERENGNSLDFACISVGQEIIDDYPASDPRWAEAVPSGTRSSLYPYLQTWIFTILFYRYSMIIQ